MYCCQQPPKLQLIAGRLELGRLNAGSRRRRRRRERELRKFPDSPGPSPEQVEIEALHKAISDAIFALNLLRP